MNKREIKRSLLTSGLEITQTELGILQYSLEMRMEYDPHGRAERNLNRKLEVVYELIDRGQVTLRIERTHDDKSKEETGL